MTYRLAKAYPDHLFLFPKEILRKMEDAGDRELRILLYVLTILTQGPCDEENLIDLVREKGYFPEEIRSALAFWLGCGVLKAQGKEKELAREDEREETAEEKPLEPEKKKEPREKKMVDADEQPFYSSLELGKAAEDNADFRNLVDYAQKKLNKIFNTSELARLWSFLDYLKMPAEVVMLVIEDCCSREKTSLRYISKMLNDLQDRGVDSYEKAEAYFLAREKSRSYENYVRRLFGLGERKLTGAEEEALRTWREDWHFGEELLDAAYEKTVASAKNPSIKYMHKILESWHGDGVKSPQDLSRKSARGEEGKAEKSFDSEDFFEAAVAKGLKNV